MRRAARLPLDERHDEHPGEDQESSRALEPREGFAQEKEPEQPSEDRLHGEQDRGVGRGRMLLEPIHEVEGERGSEESGDDDALHELRRVRSRERLKGEGASDREEGDDGDLDDEEGTVVVSADEAVDEEEVPSEGQRHRRL